MANQLSANPWKIDTLSDVALFTHNLKISHINYVDFTDPSHVAYVTDKDGNEVALLSGNSNLSTLHDSRWISGLIVPTMLVDGVTDNMPSGHLLVYFQ